MPVISDSAIAQYAKAAGLSDSNVAIAVAVAIAESGGNTNSHNAVPPDDSYGLWQINMLGSMGPARRKQFGITKNEELYDPAVNAKAMAILSNKGASWSPWTTYTRGTYRIYLERGKTVAGTTGTPTTVSTTPVGLTDSYQSVKDFFTIIQNPKFWLLFGMMMGGAGLVLIGVLKLTGDGQLSGTTKGVARAAIGLIPGGSTVVQATKAVGKAVR
jgi:hypothetical protein